jgi:hypothetical protein
MVQTIQTRRVVVGFLNGATLSEARDVFSLACLEGAGYTRKYPCIPGFARAYSGTHGFTVTKLGTPTYARVS